MRHIEHVMTDWVEIPKGKWEGSCSQIGRTLHWEWTPLLMHAKRAAGRYCTECGEYEVRISPPHDPKTVLKDADDITWVRRAYRSRRKARAQVETGGASW